MHSLEQAIRFYNTRDTMPELWYPTVGGAPKARNDPALPDLRPRHDAVRRRQRCRSSTTCPRAYRGNIDPQLPLDGRARGATPPMTERDMPDLICFLETLTDDYQPPADAADLGPLRGMKRTP